MSGAPGERGRTEQLRSEKRRFRVAASAALCLLIATLSSGYYAWGLSEEVRKLRKEQASLLKATDALGQKLEAKGAKVAELEEKERVTLGKLGDIESRLAVRTEASRQLETRMAEVVETTPPSLRSAAEALMNRLTEGSKKGDPTSAYQDWKEGRRFDLQGARGQAYSSFQSALLEIPEYPPALNSLGLLALRDGQRAKAIDLFNRALNVRANYKPAMANLGLAYLRGGDLPEAALWCARSLAVDRPLPLAEKLALGVANHNRSDGLGPLECTLDAAASEFIHRAGVEHAMGNAEKSRVSLEKGCELNAYHPRCLSIE